MRERAAQIAESIATAGGQCFVTAVVADLDEWKRPELDADAWDALLTGLDDVDSVIAEHGVSQVLHPHVDTLVEQADELDRFLDGCGRRAVPRHRPPHARWGRPGGDRRTPRRSGSGWSI